MEKRIVRDVLDIVQNYDINQYNFLTFHLMVLFYLLNKGKNTGHNYHLK
jgi:hypothetical protein